MAIYPGDPGLAGFVGGKDDRGSGDNWSYKICKAPVKSSPPSNPRALFMRCNLNLQQKY